MTPEQIKEWLIAHSADVGDCKQYLKDAEAEIESAKKGRNQCELNYARAIITLHEFKVKYEV